MFNLVIENLMEQSETFTSGKSGWIFDYIESFGIKITQFKLIGVSSYIKLPKWIFDKHAIINVKNKEDHECLKWSVVSAFCPVVKDPQRLNKRMREKAKLFDWTGINFPATDKDIDRFERQNGYGVYIIS